MIHVRDCERMGSVTGKALQPVTHPLHAWLSNHVDTRMSVIKRYWAGGHGMCCTGTCPQSPSLFLALY